MRVTHLAFVAGCCRQCHAVQASLGTHTTNTSSPWQLGSSISRRRHHQGSSMADTAQIAGVLADIDAWQFSLFFFSVLGCHPARLRCFLQLAGGLVSDCLPGCLPPYRPAPAADPDCSLVSFLSCAYAAERPLNARDLARGPAICSGPRRQNSSLYVPFVLGSRRRGGHQARMDAAAFSISMAPRRRKAERLKCSL